MDIKTNVSLADYSTMRLGGQAAYAVDVHSKSELQEAVAWAQNRQLQIIVIGTGSNVVWRDEGFAGLLIVNRILGFEINPEDQVHCLVHLGAGEPWDSAVERCVDAGLSGIEALSLIPGTAGATPVQNVGAYGQEISQTLVSLEAFDAHSGDFVTISVPDCQFGYRTSRFNAADKGRFYITSLTFRLSRTTMQPPFYPALQAYFDSRGVTSYSPLAIRQAVIDIRSHKLPDPAKIANNGSFFGNPIIDEAQFQELQAKYPGIVQWPLSDGHVKLSAAWLVDQAGFKNFQDDSTGIATWPGQSLVLVNEHAQTSQDLLNFKDKIVTKVESMFGVKLEQEPELLP